MLNAPRNYAQVNILKQLKEYIATISVFYKQDKVDFNNTVIHQILNQGSCFGISFLYAVCCALKQEAMFLEMLDKVLDWDNSLSTLDLQNKYSEKPTPLYVYFERFSSSIFSIQEPAFIDIHALQFDLFKNKQLFSMISQGKQLLQVKQSNSNGGYITSIQLAEILQKNKKNIETNFTLIHGGGHCSAIRYVDNQWVYFDPNNKSYEKFFSMVECNTLARHIMRAHFYPDEKGAMGLTCSSFEDEPIEVLGFSTIPLEQRLSYFGLHLLIRLNPQEINQIFSKEHQTSHLNAVLIHELSRVDEDGWSGFYTMVKYLPEKIDDLLKHLQLYSRNKNNKINNIKNNLNKQDKFIFNAPESTLDSIFFQNQSMRCLIKGVFEDTNNLLNILNLFKQKKINVAPVLYDLLFLTKRPNYRLISLIKTRRLVLNKILSLILNSSDTLYKLNKLIKNNHNYACLFTLYLRNVYDNLSNYCFWHKIMRRYHFNVVKSYSEILVYSMQSNKISRYKKELIKTMLLDLATLKRGTLNDLLQKKEYKELIQGDRYLLEALYFIKKKTIYIKKIKQIQEKIKR